MSSADAARSMQALLEPIGRRRSFVVDTPIIEAGMVEPPLLIILTGHASVLVPFRGRDVEVATAGPGAILGDISFLLGEPASATVIPIAEVEAIGAEQSEIRSHLATDPVLASEFFQTLAVLQAQRTHARDAQLIQLQMLGEGAF